MSPKNIADYVRLKTKTNSTTFTDSELLLYLNLYIDDFAKEILRVNEDYFGTPQTTDLIADQREYPLPIETLNSIKYVEAKLDGTNWIYLEELDLNNYKRTTDETTITSIFSNEQDSAFYDLFRNSLWIYSGTITDVTTGIKLWSFDFPAHVTDLTSTTDLSIDPSATTHGFPRAFHELLCRKIIIEKKTSGDTALPLTEGEQAFVYDFERALDSLRPANLDRAVIGTTPVSADIGDDGYEY